VWRWCMWSGRSASRRGTAAEVTLRKQSVLTSKEQVLAALETADGLVTLELEQIVIYNHTADGLA